MTYSTVRSAPYTLHDDWPRSMSTSMRTDRSWLGKSGFLPPMKSSADLMYSVSFRSNSGVRLKAPLEYTESRSMKILVFLSCSSVRPSPTRPSALPNAHARRPMFGSLPAIADLSRGELMTLLASALAMAKLGALLTLHSITCFTPSPLRTISLLSCRDTSKSASWNSSSCASGSLSPSPPPSGTRFDDSSQTVSEVDSSASMLIQLKVSATTLSSVFCSVARGTAMSVRMKTSIVAMLGSIMPAPLATPTTLAPFLRVMPNALG
mmetsp:Transcript_25135/g.62228  ORF Transcript_25135/g.62228 Transcript_25135/m.62228 type:complete len:265 (-) Transcript_25135:894-1688(-)